MDQEEDACELVIFIAVVAFLAPFVARAPAKTGLVEVVVSGVVSDTGLWFTRVPDATGPTLGDSVEFHYMVDLDEPIPIADNFRLYTMEESTFSAGGDELSRSGPAGQVQIHNRDIDSDLSNLYQAFTKIESDDPFLGFDGFSIGLQLLDSTATALDGLDHPEALDLANYDLIEFTAGCASCAFFPEDGPSVFWIRPTEISVRAAPEPATVVLLLLCAPVLYRRGRHSVVQTWQE